MATPPAEFSRPLKAGLVRAARARGGANRGTPAPDAGYALGLAEREVARLGFDHEHDRHDVVVGVALVAAKRASLVGRAPTRDDVTLVLAHFGLDSHVTHALAAPFAGLAHSYVAQRRFVDAVSEADLRPRDVVTRH
jgi:hypothetical protein